MKNCNLGHTSRASCFSFPSAVFIFIYHRNPPLDHKMFSSRFSSIFRIHWFFSLYPSVRLLVSFYYALFSSSFHPLFQVQVDLSSIYHSFSFIFSYSLVLLLISIRAFICAFLLCSCLFKVSLVASGINRFIHYLSPFSFIFLNPQCIFLFLRACICVFLLYSYLFKLSLVVICISRFILYHSFSFISLILQCLSLHYYVSFFVSLLCNLLFKFALVVSGKVAICYSFSFMFSYLSELFLIFLRAFLCVIVMELSLQTLIRHSRFKSIYYFLSKLHSIHFLHDLNFHVVLKIYFKSLL